MLKVICYIFSFAVVLFGCGAAKMSSSHDVEHEPVQQNNEVDMGDEIVQIYGKSTAGGISLYTTSKHPGPCRRTDTFSKGKHALEYSYDNRGQLIRIERPPYGKTDSVLLKIEYDNNGRTIQITDINGTRKYFYDEVGRLIRQEYDYYGDGKTNSSLQFEYNSEGKVSRMKRVDFPDDPNECQKGEFLREYNNNGHVVRAMRRWVKCSDTLAQTADASYVEQLFKYYYDEKGDIRLREEYTGRNGNRKIEEYKYYGYDANRRKVWQQECRRSPEPGISEHYFKCSNTTYIWDKFDNLISENINGGFLPDQSFFYSYDCWQDKKAER